MSAEFRLGRQDNRVVEEFLLRTPAPTGVRTIIVDAQQLKSHQLSIDAARSIGVGIVVETLTERLVEPGYAPSGLPYSRPEPLVATDLDTTSSRLILVEQVVSVQQGVATLLVPPHFFITNRAELELNLALLRLTREHVGPGVPIRAILAGNRTFFASTSILLEVAVELERAGIKEVDLRMSPLGGSGVGPQAIRSALETAKVLKDKGLKINFGFAGLVARTAFALGCIDSFTTGVGTRERYDFNAAIKNHRRIQGSQKASFGQKPGVYLPDIGITVTSKTGKSLYADRSIRTKLICKTGPCADAIDGPVVKASEHYLHSVASFASRVRDRPSDWLVRTEGDRLTRAVELLDVVNAAHTIDGDHPIEGRTLRSLHSEVNAQIRKRHLV